jgi:hypothetical protein
VPSPSFGTALKQFAEAVTQNFATAIPAQHEDQLKTPVQNLLSAIGDLIDKRVVGRTEAHISELGVRPDIGVAVDDLLTGYIELKAPGKGAQPQRYTGRDAEQWKKFKNIPNLIYTDGSEWALFRNGEQRRNVVRFAGDITMDGRVAIDANDISKFQMLLVDFLSWEPIVPSTPQALAELLAPICRLIRSDVGAALEDQNSSLSLLKNEWKQTLFPDADDLQFADAYAQTLTYALLLAKFSGQEDVQPEQAAQKLDSGHGLLAQVLRILSQAPAREELGSVVDLLIRIINKIKIDVLQSNGSDLWIYFYEEFLAAYDSKLRNDRGVYYTPAQVIGAQVRLISCLLEDPQTFNKPLSYADENVVVLDPAAGTGAYALAVLNHGLEKVKTRYGPGVTSGYATTMAKNIHAFENMVGPYSVAHLRVTQGILGEGGALPPDGVHVYLSDTLETPYAPSTAQLTLQNRILGEEHQRAQQIKQNTRVLVCLGNPPYDRQEIPPEVSAERRRGGWIRFGEDINEHRTVGILRDFIDPAIRAGQGGAVKNLYNDYVYFWRWGLWKVFESFECPGIISFITAASYLRGPGFIGMREWMRRIFDELWIINLEGDSRGARKTENVFDIQTPVAIAIGVRYGPPNPNKPAIVHYSRIEGSRLEKFEILNSITKFSDVQWDICYSDWTAPFLPEQTGKYYQWPLVTDIFPWQSSGVKYGRTWPIGETRSLLERRWHRLFSAPQGERRQLFHDTPTGRKFNRQYFDLYRPRIRLRPLCEVSIEPIPLTVRYRYRSFDRQWALVDSRLIDRPSPHLWRAESSQQVYMSCFITGVLGEGPSATVTSEIPDLDHFRGSFGGKHVIPLWRNTQATEPNVTAGLLQRFEHVYGVVVQPEDIFAYCYAILSSPTYVKTFWDELYEPGPHVPITKDRVLFFRVASMGKYLIYLHTYAERFVPESEQLGIVPQGRARNTRSILSNPESYPKRFSYDSVNCILHVGDGEFAPIDPAVWEFSVSGLQVLSSWLSYRMAEGAGRRSSPLDDIRPDSWTSDMTRELLELIWVLEGTIGLFPKMEDTLKAVISSPLLNASDLPQPSHDERQAPGEETEDVGPINVQELGGGIANDSGALMKY